MWYKRVMLNNNKEINPSNSMIDIAYRILSQNKEPMVIQELIQKVFEIKKMDINNKEICARLYLDIVSSGLFIFCGNDLWNIKANNLHFLDQEYFEEDEKLLPTEIDEEVLDFNDFDLNKEKTKDNEDEKEELEEELDVLDIPLDRLDDNDEKLEEEFNGVDKNKEEDENEEEYINGYDDYFYK
ncbi:MAG: DNA-directed RNA polymerase subunit delta [Phytoplasma sp.]|uniref:DNA-directed RNA polymerase subunit delta n=1 Tax=Phytoplasma sp. TaxID=2155 RepID=UPI002B40509B|nr:DNA-directed RNA polymerase subunit delta [Phytoplasma sp.]WRH06846.1 MAG: DNA-directed RNA polymerase subunit delta [Phytoplasma sp.]